MGDGAPGVMSEPRRGKGGGTDGQTVEGGITPGPTECVTPTSEVGEAREALNPRPRGSPTTGPEEFEFPSPLTPGP